MKPTKTLPTTFPERIWLTPHQLERIYYGQTGNATLEASIYNHQRPQEIPYVPEHLMQEALRQARAEARREIGEELNATACDLRAHGYALSADVLEESILRIFGKALREGRSSTEGGEI